MQKPCGSDDAKSQSKHREGGRDGEGVAKVKGVARPLLSICPLFSIWSNSSRFTAWSSDQWFWCPSSFFQLSLILTNTCTI